MKKHTLLAWAAALLLTLSLAAGCGQQNRAGNTKSNGAAARDYQRIVVLSDLHYPSKTSEKKADKRNAKKQRKEAAMKEIAQWPDVDLAAFTGDMVELSPSDKDIALVRGLIDTLPQPKAFVTGNHEMAYSPTRRREDGRLLQGTQQEKEDNLKRFEKAFGPLYYTKDLGRYLLVFLSVNRTDTRETTEYDAKELAWLRDTLAKNRHKPTLVFSHPPLRYTWYAPEREKWDKSRLYANPSETLDAILKENPQVLLWVSGHTHTPPDNPTFATAANYYKGLDGTWNHAVLDIYNPTWDGKKTIWTNSLYLYKDHIQVRTYNHETHQWMTQFDRTVTVPENL
jgi:predicted MPP superfamily phosphohydrolase